MFIDQAEIFVKSGKGGDGMVHMHREKYVPRGGPDGGDGGQGGDVILEVRATLNTLSAFRHMTSYLAQEGKNGGANNKSGRAGNHLVIPVPPGTLVFAADSNELLGDLTMPGQQLVVCKGGRGGRGNQHFATSKNQAPRMGERGEPAEEKQLRLELKLIADIGLIGVPNAGKSTLLAALTNARPKIAPYPFTTLVPNLGVAEIDRETQVVLADIPGLIAGASEGVGLGMDFLRHIQRTRVLIHLLDGLSADPLADFSQINAELALFDPKLSKKPQVVALNKMDQPEVQERLPKLKKELKKRGYDLLNVSAITGADVRNLLIKAQRKLAETPTLEEPQTSMPVYRPKEDPRQFVVTREGSSDWRVSGAGIERAAEMTYFEHRGSLRRFQKMMEILGVEDQLRKAGVQDGHTVHIGDFELEWQD